MREDFFTRRQRLIGVSLNPVQRQAVEQTEGPMLLLATPGSGKTTTIIMRIGYLIEEKGVPPSRIKAVTFSQASARDMKERFRRFFPEYESVQVDFSTIHSLAFEIARDYWRQRGMAFRVIEHAGADVDKDQPAIHKQAILRELCKRLTGEFLADEQMEQLTTYISYVKNKMLPPERWDQVPCDVQGAARILQEYEIYKRSAADELLVDFDDMLSAANQAMMEDERLLARYQRRYDYVLTDESQDTSLLQHAIIEQVVWEHGNLCVVADDDQSIYTWRAAEPQYLLNFKQVYPQAAILKMEHNYRSTGKIVQAANRFIERNRNRYDKRMTTDNPEGEPIVTTSLPHYLHQAQYVAERVLSAGASSYGQTAVLYRNNSSAIPLVSEFDRLGIPFYMKDGHNRFFKHWVVQDILNFMRLAYADKRPDILARIYTKLNAYITKDQMAALMEIRNDASVFDNLLRYCNLRDYQPKQLLECKAAFKEMRTAPPQEAIQTIRYRLGYEKVLEKRCERGAYRKDSLFGILDTLEVIAGELETLEQFAKRLKYLEEAMDSAKYKRDEFAVTFSTMHSAKGLEFEQVYMIDLIEGTLPSTDDIGDPAGMEEAVRLFYVGMTRAKRRLELISYRMRSGEDVRESQFVRDVRRMQAPSPPSPEPGKGRGQGPAAAGAGRAPHAAGTKVAVTRGKRREVEGGGDERESDRRIVRRASQLAKGMRIKHRGFGEGEILEVDDADILIRFETGINRVSMARCLREKLLEIVGRPTR